MTVGPIFRQLTLFALPLMLGNIFQMLYNTVDSVIVGNFVSKQALAAIGSTTMIVNMMVFFFNGFSIGASVIIGQFFGARELEKLHKAIETTMAGTFLLSIFFSVFGILLVNPLLHFMSTPDDVFSDAGLYLRIYIGGISGLLIYNMGSGILRAVGDSTRPLYFLILTSILNIVLDLLFVAVLPWGVAGAAWATVISLTFSAALLLVHLGRQQGPWRFQLKKLRIYPSSLRRILYLGVPAAVQGSMYSLSNIIIQAAVNNFGTVTVAAWTALGKFDALYWVTSNAMGTALCTFVGQNFGAGQYERMRKGVKQWLLTDIGVTAAMSVLLLSLSPWMLRMFSADAEVIALARRMMWYFAPFYVVWVFIDILSNALRGAGDSFWPMVISLMGVCLLRVLWIVLVVPRWNTIAGVSFSYPFTWGVTALTYLIYYLKAPWLERCTRAARGHAHE